MTPALHALVAVALLGSTDVPGEPRFAFKQGRKFGFVSATGEKCIDAVFDKAFDFEGTRAVVMLRGRWGFVDDGGRLVAYFPNNAQPVGNFAERCMWFRQNGKFGLIDRDGRIVRKPEFDDVGEFTDGLARVNVGAFEVAEGVVGGGLWGYVDSDGKLPIHPQFETASSFSSGFARVELANGQRWFIDRQGKRKHPVSQGVPGLYSEGLSATRIAGVKGRGYVTRYRDVNGKSVLTIGGYGGEFSEGLATVKRELDTPTAGYIDKSGRVRIPFRFADAEPFAEGLAAVQDAQSALWGFVNNRGEMTVAAEFNAVSQFQGGVCKAHRGGKMVTPGSGPEYWTGGEWVLIDREGKLLCVLERD